MMLKAVEDRGLRFVAGHGRLRVAAEARSVRLAQLLAKAGVVGNPYLLAGKTLFLAILTACLAIPAGVILYFLWAPLAFVSVVPAFVYLLPELRLKDKVAQRKEGVEKELPFFSILVNVLGSAGVSLYAVIVSTIGHDAFPYIRSEALLMKREVTVFGSDPNEALDKAAEGHPSKKFGAFVSGYTSKARSGGDVSAYLSGESGFLLRELEDAWTRYASRAGTVGSTMLTVFGLLPLLLLIVGVFSTQVSVNGLALFTAVGVPFFTVLLIFMAGRMQPVGERGVTGDFTGSIAVASPAVAVFFLTGQVWMTIAAGLAVFLLAYGVSVRSQLRENREIDEALPEFLKDLLEYKRQEYDLAKSLLKIASSNKYNPSFDSILAKMAMQLKAGTPVDELNIETKTRLSRMAFLVIGQMGRSGGGTVDTIYQLCAYTTKVVEMKRNTTAEMKPYIILSYVSPLLLSFGVTFIGGILGSFTQGPSPGASALRLSGVGLGGITPTMLQVSSILIVVSAAALGIIAAKMVDFTVRNTMRSCVNVVVATAATIVVTSIGFQGLLHLL